MNINKLITQFTFGQQGRLNQYILIVSIHKIIPHDEHP